VETHGTLWKNMETILNYTLREIYKDKFTNVMGELKRLCYDLTYFNFFKEHTLIGMIKPHTCTDKLKSIAWAVGCKRGYIEKKVNSYNILKWLKVYKMANSFYCRK
jgi:hypothetical protein